MWEIFNDGFFPSLDLTCLHPGAQKTLIIWVYFSISQNPNLFGDSVVTSQVSKLFGDGFSEFENIMCWMDLGNCHEILSPTMMMLVIKLGFSYP